MWMYVPILQIKVLILFSVMCRVKKQQQQQKNLLWRIRGEYSQKEVALEQNLDDQMQWKRKEK